MRSGPANILCRRCAIPLTGARLKGPTHGWYCSDCYRVTFIMQRVVDNMSVVSVATIEIATGTA